MADPQLLKLQSQMIEAAIKEVVSKWTYYGVNVASHVTPQEWAEITAAARGAANDAIAKFKGGKK